MGYRAQFRGDPQRNRAGARFPPVATGIKLVTRRSRSLASLPGRAARMALHCPPPLGLDNLAEPVLGVGGGGVRAWNRCSCLVLIR
jgi:hypothetical protein